MPGERDIQGCGHVFDIDRAYAGGQGRYKGGIENGAAEPGSDKLEENRKVIGFFGKCHGQRMRIDQVFEKRPESSPAALGSDNQRRRDEF